MEEDESLDSESEQSYHLTTDNDMPQMPIGQTYSEINGTDPDRFDLDHIDLDKFLGNNLQMDNHKSLVAIRPTLRQKQQAVFIHHR